MKPQKILEHAPKVLTQAQREAYFRDGYLALPAFVSREWLDRLWAVTDEFVEPIAVVDSAGAPIGPVADGDSVIFFNFRADRARQVTRAFTETGFDGFARDGKPDISYLCMTRYDETFTLPIAFPPVSRKNILAEVAAGAGKSTLLKTISGLVRSRAGTIKLDGRDIQRLAAHKIVAGDSVPNGRGYWLVSERGTFHTFGNVNAHGGLFASGDEPVVGIAELLLALTQALERSFELLDLVLGLFRARLTESQPGLGSVDGVPLAPIDDHRGAFGREGPRHGAADAPAGSCDDRGPSGERGSRHRRLG